MTSSDEPRAGMKRSARDKIERRAARVREALLPDGVDPVWISKMITRTGRDANVPDHEIKQASQDLVRLLTRDIPALLVAAQFCQRPHVPADDPTTDGSHVIEFREDGWTIMHPMSCRPDLFACVTNRVAEGNLRGQPFEAPGRYLCSMIGDDLVVGARIDWP
jgi:hypothetical protein